MSRTAHRNLANKTVRLKLKARRKAYFTSLERCLLLGYIRRPGSEAGRWVVQREIGRRETGTPIHRAQSIGKADDYSLPDGHNVLSYDQAVHVATSGELTSSTGPLTVRQAVARYLAHVKAHNGERAETDARGKLRLHVLREDVDGKALDDKPGLGDVPVARLSSTQLDDWLTGLVRRSKDDPDKERRSKDTANRVLASFKAALNMAFEDDKNKISADKPWRVLKAFKGVGARREDHFTEAEVKRLIRCARKQDPHFADLLKAAFYTGARAPGELAALDVRHFDPKRAQLKIIEGKTGQRVTTLTKEGVAFFKRITAGKKPEDVLLPREDGGRWGKNHQQKPLKGAPGKPGLLAQAELPQSAGNYTIRHTYISRAIERGMPLTLIADNVGTSIQMIERNYGKFIAETRRDLIERTAPSLR